MTNPILDRPKIVRHVMTKEAARCLSARYKAHAETRMVAAAIKRLKKAKRNLAIGGSPCTPQSP